MYSYALLNKKRRLQVGSSSLTLPRKRGEVIAVGGGTKDEEMVLKAGDIVLYGKYAGTEVEHEGEKYLIMRQSDVLATL